MSVIFDYHFPEHQNVACQCNITDEDLLTKSTCLEYKFQAIKIENKLKKQKEEKHKKEITELRRLVAEKMKSLKPPSPKRINSIKIIQRSFKHHRMRNELSKFLHSIHIVKSFIIKIQYHRKRPPPLPPSDSPAVSFRSDSHSPLFQPLPPNANSSLYTSPILRSIENQLLFNSNIPHISSPLNPSRKSSINDTITPLNSSRKSSLNEPFTPQNQSRKSSINEAYTPQNQSRKSSMNDTPPPPPPPPEDNNNNVITQKSDLILALVLGYRVRSRMKSEKGKGLINQIRDTIDLIDTTPIDDSNAADFVDSLVQQKVKQIDKLYNFLTNSNDYNNRLSQALSPSIRKNRKKRSSSVKPISQPKESRLPRNMKFASTMRMTDSLLATQPLPRSSGGSSPVIASVTPSPSRIKPPNPHPIGSGKKHNKVTRDLSQSAIIKPTPMINDNITLEKFGADPPDMVLYDIRTGNRPGKIMVYISEANDLKDEKHIDYDHLEPVFYVTLSRACEKEIRKKSKIYRGTNPVLNALFEFPLKIPCEIDGGTLAGQIIIDVNNIDRFTNQPYLGQVVFPLGLFKTECTIKPKVYALNKKCAGDAPVRGFITVSMALRAGTNPNTHNPRVSRFNSESISTNTVDSSLIRAAADMARRQQQQDNGNSKRMPLKSDVSSFETMSTQPIVREESKSMYKFNSNGNGNSKYRRNSVESNTNKRSNSPMSMLRKTLQPKLIDFTQQKSSSSSSSSPSTVGRSIETPSPPPPPATPLFSPSPLQNPINDSPPSPPSLLQPQQQASNDNTFKAEVISFDDIVNDIKLYQQQQSEYETDSENPSYSNDTSNIVSRKSSLRSYLSQKSDFSYLDDINRAVESVQKVTMSPAPSKRKKFYRHKLMSLQRIDIIDKFEDTFNQICRKTPEYNRIFYQPQEETEIPILSDSSSVLQNYDDFYYKTSLELLKKEYDEEIEIFKKDSFQ